MPTVNEKAKPDRHWLQAAHDAGGSKYLRGIDEAPMDLEAAGENEQKLPLMSGTMYSGGLLNVGMAWPVVLDLADTSVVAQQVPVHREHDRNRIVGHTTQIDLAAKHIKFKGVLSGVGIDAEEVKGTARNGFPWRPSLGSGYRRLEYVDRGQKVTVNGRSFSGPLYVARGATIREMGIVTIAGDDNSNAAIAASHQEREMGPFEKWLEAKGFDPATITDGARKFLEAQYKVEQDAAEKASAGGTINAGHRDSGAGSLDTVELMKSMRREFRGEQLRISQIQAAFGGRFPEEEARAIADENYTAEKAELHVLRAGRPQSPAFSSDSGEEDANVYACAMARANGVREATLEAMFGEQTVDKASGSKWNGFGPQAMMDVVMLKAGFSWSGSRKSIDYLSRHREAELKLKAAGFSQTTLATALTLTARAIAKSTWAALTPKWPAFCGVKSHNDFKAVTHVQINAAGSVQVVGPTGQLPSMSLSHATTSLQLKTFGTRLTTTRQDKINDDIGAFGEIPKVLTRAMSVRVDEEAAKVLLALIAGGSFFTTAKGNALASGGSSAFAHSSLGSAVQLFDDRVDSEGKPYALEADRLFGGTALAEPFLSMYTSDKIVTGSTGKNLDNNIYRGRYQGFTSTFLSNTRLRDQDKKAYSSQSSTAWLLLCNPELAAVCYIAFLNGNQEPTITDAVVADDILGETSQMYHDVGVGNGDDFAGVYSPGA